MSSSNYFEPMDEQLQVFKVHVILLLFFLFLRLPLPLSPSLPSPSSSPPSPVPLPSLSLPSTSPSNYLSSGMGISHTLSSSLDQTPSNQGISFLLLLLLYTLLSSCLYTTAISLSLLSVCPSSFSSPSSPSSHLLFSHIPPLPCNSSCSPFPLLPLLSIFHFIFFFIYLLNINFSFLFSFFFLRSHK